MGTPTPFGFASRLGRETLLQRWSHQIPRSGNPLGLRSAPYACGTATPIGASCTPVPWLGGNPTASRHNGQSSPLGLLPPADFGGTPTPDPSVGKPSCRTGSARRCSGHGAGSTTRLTRRPSGSPVA
ncbi:hypothetical protein DP114_31650 [Brasilonema sennae CENA114]|uniref:Uncharacterized protein n=1 Tax=Brasilonema sennae CENA114 TaxID=415709 RepID=A0A856MMF2_9CYAN|nr:hypothetical protein DP114_31650 [Brasilonema sennae CENA114]